MDFFGIRIFHLGLDQKIPTTGGSGLGFLNPKKSSAISRNSGDSDWDAKSPIFLLWWVGWDTGLGKEPGLSGPGRLSPNFRISGRFPVWEFKNFCIFELFRVGTGFLTRPEPTIPVPGRFPRWILNLVRVPESKLILSPGRKFPGRVARPVA